MIITKDTIDIAKLKEIYTNSRVAQWNNHVRHMIIQDADKSLITRNDLIQKRSKKYAARYS